MTSSTGILGDRAGTSPIPLDDTARNKSKLSKISTDGAGNGVDRSNREEDKDRLGDIPKTIQKSSSAGGTSGNVRKQEDFEDTYRARSAMAKLNLKKDILRVGDETHDAPDGLGGRRREHSRPGERGCGVGGGTADGMNINASAQAAGAATAGAGYGIPHTISLKKSTRMMEKQMQKEKQWMRGLASGRGSGRSSRESSGGKQRQICLDMYDLGLRECKCYVIKNSQYGLRHPLFFSHSFGSFCIDTSFSSISISRFVVMKSLP